MSNAPQIKNVVYDESRPLMDREQIDMLLMVDEGESSNSLVKEIFEIYAKESSDKLEGLERVCDNRDGGGLRKIVHFIAGSSGNLGLARLCAFLRAIEHAIDDGKLEDFESCKVLIPREFDQACSQFRKSFDL